MPGARLSPGPGAFLGLTLPFVFFAGCSGGPEPASGAVPEGSGLEVLRRTHRAEAFLEVRENDRAMEECFAGLDRQPGNESLLALLGEAALGSGRPEMATPRLAAAAQAEGALPHVSVAYGRCLYESGKSEEGLSVLEEIARKHPDSLEVHRALGRIYFDLRRDEASAAAYEKVRQAQPQEHDTLLTLGALYERLGRLESAEAAYVDAVGAHPGSAMAHRALAELYASRNMDDQAAEHLSRYLEIYSDALDAEEIRKRIESLRQGESH